MTTDISRLSAGLQQILDDAVAAGEETGCQLAIFDRGTPVINLAAGNGITTDTLFPVFSAGKGLMTTAVHRLVERGVLSYDTRVADLWPEFGCNGKEDVRVWHILTHRSGLHQLPAVNAPEEQADWKLMCDRIAAMKPVWTPGTKCEYQGITYAWLLGEVAQRADGRDFRRIVTEEVLAPLGLEHHFFFGTARPYAAPALTLCPGEEPPWAAQFIGCDAIRHGLVPSANGLGTAYALARHYAALKHDIDGVRLLRPETVANATFLRRAADDPAGETWAKFGLGYALCGPEPEVGRMFGHGGALGAEGLADKQTGLAIGFTKNQVTPTHPVHPVRDRISRLLGLPVRHW
ncbi:MAG: serine hydrolase domain-containing protein [Lentisphaeria bacterium]